MNKLWELTAIYGAVLLVNLLYTVIAPFYPLVADRKGVPQWLVGHIFTTMPVTSFLITPLVSRNLKWIGYSRMMIIGLVLAVRLIQGASLGLIGLSISQQYTQFIIISLLGRISGGVGFCAMYTASLSYISYSFPQEKESLISFLEMFGGFGLILGPLLCTSLHTVFSYSTLLYLLASVLGIYTPLIYYAITNRGQEDDESAVQSSMWKLCKNKRILLDLLVNVFANMVFNYLEPFLSLFMYYKGYGEESGAIGFLSTMVSYMFACLVLSLFASHIKNFWLMAGSCLVCSLGMSLLGPLDYVYNIPLAGVCIGTALLGVGSAIGFVTTIPSMLEEAERKGRQGDEIHDLVSGLFSMSYTLGEILGPQVASNGVYFFNAKISGLVMVGIGLSLLGVYLVFRRPPRPKDLLGKPLLSI